MRNEHASDGIAEDLIRAFVQAGCAELHLKTLVEKTVAKIENPSPEDGDLIVELEEYERQMNDATNLRRSAMRNLFNLYNGNKDAWCLVKHLGLASMTMFEAYQASDNDTELYDLWIKSNKAFTKSLCIFLGVEITDCAACFADMLKEN